MSDSKSGQTGELEEFRGYLSLLARAQLGVRLRRKVDPSDIVQDALLEAHKDRESFRGTGAKQRAAWLRGILAHRLANVVRDLRCEKRDVDRERPLDVALRESDMRLEKWLAARDTTPSACAARKEAKVALAEALTSLPEDQQDALVLRHLEELTLEEIADRLGTSRRTVARLLVIGTAALRQKLVEFE